jgi:hypothetical protein
MPGGTRSFHFSTGGGGPNGFHFSNADDIFSQFMRGGGVDGDDDFFGGGGGFGMGGMPGGMGGGGKGRGRFAGGRRAPEPEVTVVEKPLAVSLEELYGGTTKKLKIKRKTYDSDTGRQSTQDRILEVPIKKGLKAGSKIKFSDVGDQVEGGTQDLHFIVSEVSYKTRIELHQIEKLTFDCRKHIPSSPAKATTSNTSLNSTSRRPLLVGDGLSRRSMANNSALAAADQQGRHGPKDIQILACQSLRSHPTEGTLSLASRSSSRLACRVSKRNSLSRSYKL